MTLRETATLGETTVHNRGAVDLDERLSRSELLAEAVVAESVSTFFAPTWASEGATLVDHDLRAPEQDIWLTPLVSEAPPRARAGYVWRAKTEKNDLHQPFDKTNSNRVALLARKYVSRENFAEEDNARLAILTERVRRLLPAVTVAEVEALERALTATQEVNESDIAIRRLLGLPLPPGA